MGDSKGGLNWGKVGDMSSGQVHVVFIDVGTGQRVGETLLPLEQLPASFKTETKLQIGDDEWSVVTAEPMTAEEFGRTGELKLTLSKIMRMSPKDILYSLPTIWADIPPFAPNTTSQGKNVLNLHEDDWRQVELISAGYQDAIRSEFEAVARIFKDAGEFNGSFWGFREMHIRRSIVQPVQPVIRMGEMLAVLPQTTLRFDGISYEGTDGLLQGGFAFGMEGLALYGSQVDGVASMVGIYRIRSAIGADLAAAQALTLLMQAHRLYLVEWCSMTAVPPQEHAVRAYLGIPD